MDKVDFSIILPVYNQAPHIRGRVASYCEALSRIPGSFEILLVVNGDRDNSLEVCRELEREFAGVRVLYSTESGWGLAVRKGLRAAEGHWVCYTNSARTSAPDLILLLLYARANSDVVIKANRRIRENWRRRLGSLLFNIECRMLFDLPYWDVNGTPKVFPRSFEKLLGLARNDSLIDLEFNVVCRRENYLLLEVPILSTTRHGGKSTTHYGTALEMYWGALRMWKSERDSAR